MRAFPLVVFLAFTASANAQNRTPLPPVPDAIELPDELDRVLRDYEAAWLGSDEAALAALFTPDGFILRPGHGPVRGREAIREAYANSGGAGLILTAYAYAHEGDVGYIIGGYRYDPDGIDSGKYTLTLRRLEDGRWYIASDMDNGNRR
ncbi:MAG: nuclear transport factor 2 family protein [Rhodothermales bacterium]|nr:nuclear transport factor 2 family protein [Rhodothermales bacterium]MBO6781180.1 nuclear transport factor 2 family protein [Rhodothermales bacterium]